MANKHISALNPAAEKWKTVISHTEHLFLPWPILQIKVKCLNISVSPAQTHRWHTTSGALMLVTNTNFQHETVTVNEMYFQVKQVAEKPKMSNRACYFIHQELMECKFAVDCGGLHPSWHTVGAQWLTFMQPSWRYYIQMKDYEKQTFFFLWNNTNSVL